MEILTAKYFKVEAVSGTSGGHKGTLTGEFDFHYEISCWCSVVTICLKHAVFDVVAWDRQTDRQTDGPIATSASLNARYITGGGSMGI